MKKGAKIGIAVGVAALAVAGGTFGAIAGGVFEKAPEYDFTVDYDGIAVAETIKDVAVHDPSIIKEDGTYYIFGSHMAAASSTDLTNWTLIGNGYSGKNKVFTDLKNYDSGEFDYAGNKASLNPTEDGEPHVWAPDVIYNEAQGLYYMYYCTSSNWNTSDIVYATSENVDGPYEWKGTLIYSGFTVDTIEATNVLDYVDEETAIDEYTQKAGYEYNYKEYPNAIDPTVFYDADGKMWMVYGSWSGGIFLLEIDESTGEVIHPEADPDNNVDPYFGKRLLGGGHTSIEAPYILYDADAGYYYLYVAYGELTRGGGYQIRVFRSETVDGDYVDMNGARPDIGDANAFYGLKLSGNYYLPSLEMGYKATGHCSAMIDDDGKRYICYHTRFDMQSETHTPRVKQYFINEEGWPCMLPYATNGETISDTGYEEESLVGRYYVVNQGTGIDSEVAEPFILYLNADGSIVGEDIEGSWKVTDNSCYVHITYDDKEYSGVFCQMQDEAGTDVMTFTAAGSNESIWGVKY